MKLAGLFTAGLAMANALSTSSQRDVRGQSEYHKPLSSSLAPSNAKKIDPAPQRRLEYVSNYPECRADVDSSESLVNDFYANIRANFDSMTVADYDQKLTDSGLFLSIDKLNFILEYSIDNPLSTTGYQTSQEAIEYYQDKSNFGGVHSCIDSTLTNTPTGQPTGQPSVAPTTLPTSLPTFQNQPSTNPTSSPSTAPSTPSAAPSSSPTQFGLVLYDCNDFPDMKKDCLQMNHLYEYSNKALGFNIDFGIPSGVASPDLVYDYLSYDPVDMIDSYKSYKDIAKKFDGVAGYPAFQEWDSSCQSQLEGLVDSSQPSYFTDVKNFLELCEDSSETVLKNLRDEVYVTVEQAGEAIDLIATSLEHTGKNQEKDLKGSKGKEPKKMSVSTEFPSNDFFNHGDGVATLSAHSTAVDYPGVEISNIEDLSTEAEKQHDDTAFSYGTAWTFLVGAAVAVVSGSAYLYCTQKNTDEEQNEGIDQNRDDIDALKDRLEALENGNDDVSSVSSNGENRALARRVNRLEQGAQLFINMFQPQNGAAQNGVPLHPNVDLEEVDVEFEDVEGAPGGNLVPGLQREANPVPMLDPRVYEFYRNLDVNRFFNAPVLRQDPADFQLDMVPFQRKGNADNV